MRWRPRVATVLLAVNLLIILLPLCGIVVLRLYESELIRRTESELTVQGALVASMYRTELLKRLASGDPGDPVLSKFSAYGVAITASFDSTNDADGPWKPVEPSLDVARDRILPPAPSALQAHAPADVYAQMAAQNLTPVLLSAARVTLSGIRVMDYQGVVVASTRSDLGKSLTGQEEVTRALRGEHVSVLRERLGEGPAPPLDSISRGSGVRVFVAMPVVERDRVLGAVLLSRTPLDSFKATYRTRFYLLGGFAVILLVMGGVTALTALLVTRPVKALIRQAQEVIRGEKGAVAAPLKRPGTFEVALLSRVLVEMSATLEKRGDYIRTFASHVSHEFKTPLTSIRGTVELLKDHFGEMSDAERSRFLHMLEQDTDRLTRLVQKLLELARAEVVRPGNERAYVTRAFERIRERFRADGVHVTFEPADDARGVIMAQEILDSILSNLVDNARQHAGPAVHVHLTARHITYQEWNMMEIVVKDDGRGMPAADAERVFTPFFTTARESGSTGLGLPIVRALVTAHNGTIVLETSQSGARFRVTLPTDEGEPLS